jgi:hypothetical protein
MPCAAITVPGMSFVRRVEIGAVSLLALLVLATAAVGAGAGTLGFELPTGVAGALSSGAGALGWRRLLVFAALVYGVVCVRED